jgi:hypothetical protein
VIHLLPHLPLLWAMYRRACSILQQPDATASRSSSQPATRVTRTLTSEQVMARWQTLVLKIGLIFRMIATETTVKQLLGELVYNRWFRKPMTDTATRAIQPIVSRVIKGQAVGRELARGEGKQDAKKASMDPALCQHPESDMQSRGNAKNSWWHCAKCMSRWERTDVALVNTQTQEPNSMDLVTFGRHMGKTYEQVLQDPQYCKWVLETVEQGESVSNLNLRRLGDYIHHVQMQATYAADDWTNADMEQDEL